MAAHRWMAMIPYELSDDDARKFVQGAKGYENRSDIVPLAGDEAPLPDDPRPWLGVHNIVRELASVGCWECESPWTPEVAAAPCPGQPPGELTYVDGQGRVTDTREPAPAGLGAIGAAVGSVGRNDPCPCGSGRKYKRCHGAG